MIFFKDHKVAVLDMTHGGSVLAAKLGSIAGSVTAVDVYNTLSAEELEALESERITVSKEPNASDFDVIVAPVHLDDNHPVLARAFEKNIPVLSHHAAVGQILAGYGLKDKTFIEITGTRAKTSTAILLADILSREKKVISHTSQGVNDWSTGKTIRKGLSITPASILTALDHVEEAGTGFDVFISEVSLGGTGFADMGVITTIADDYRIANDTKRASDAKRQMILNAKPESTLVINNNALRYFGACRRDLNLISFSEKDDASCSVYYEDTAIAFFLEKHGRIRLPEAGSYDTGAYRTAFVCASACALALGMDASVIENALHEFEGAQGRMKKGSLEGRNLIDNSNSGMDIRSAEKALEFSKAEGGRIVMVLGEEAEEVCEGLDPLDVERFIQTHMHELDALVLVGERMKRFVKNNIYHAGDLSSGIERAKKLTGEKDTILSCVKCFR